MWRYILVFILLFGLVLPLTAQDSPIATVKTVNGQLLVKRANDNDWKPIAVGGHLFTGDQVKTGENDRAAILFMYGSQLKLNANSVITLQGKQEPKSLVKRLTMAVGEIWANVTKERGLFQVETPTSVATVKGTILAMKVTEEMTILYVEEGVVELANEQGSVIADDQKQAVSRPSQPPVLSEQGGGLQPWYDHIEPEWGLRLIPDQSRAYRDETNLVRVTVFRLDTGMTYTDFNNKVEVTSDSRDVLFSVNRTDWQPIQEVQIEAGEGNVWMKTTRGGNFSVVVSADNCQPGQIEIIIEDAADPNNLDITRPNPVIINFENGEGQPRTLQIEVGE